MMALTVHQPWAWAISVAGKDIENRDWAPPAGIIGQRIAIHAGKKYDEPAWTYLSDPTTSPIDRARLSCDGTFDVPDADEAVRGAVVAVATVTGRMWRGEGQIPHWPWYCGPCGWILQEVVALDTPVPCRGRQKLWVLPAEVEAAVRAQL